MNSFSIFTFLLCVALSYCSPADSIERYPNKYDKFDYEAVMRSERLVKAYVNCILNNVGCTPEGKALREYLPDALKTNCSKCTEPQRTGAVKVMNGLEKHYPDELKKVLKKFDPDHKLWDAFKKANNAIN